MKRIKMGILALAAITGIGGAFAFNHPQKPAGTVYYSYLSGTHVMWETNRGDLSCTTDPAHSQFACTITSTSSGVTSLQDAYPAQKTVDPFNNGGAGKINE